MNTAIYIILLILILGLFALVLFLLFGNSSSKNTKNIENLLAKLLGEQNNQQNIQMQSTINMVLQQLNRHQESQERASQTFNTRIDHATKVVSDVQGKLLQLEEANKRIFEVSKDISSLQSILQAPKLRGTMGEVWLKELISQILPADRYKMQYRFKNGNICDAVIILHDGMILPIDSKFSLENFVKMLDSQGSEQDAYKKMFYSDTKKRIDEISNKYIVASEGTLDLAFMYIPAENVYYQAFIQSEDGSVLLNYAFKRKVIPVSPSSFYAYLQVILTGLRGMQIQKEALQVQNNIIGLQDQFDKFKTNYSVLGNHLKNARNCFETGDSRLEKIENKFIQIAEKVEVNNQIESPEKISQVESIN